MQNKSKKRFILYGIGIILLISFAVSLILHVNLKGEHDEFPIIAYQDTIAIVNLDEGISQEDSMLNYGNLLTEVVSADIMVTGLQDARNGLDTGRYSGYLVIPASFSANMTTINEKPVTSEFTYAVAAGLTGTQRDKTIYNVYSIYNTFRNNISEIYTATILEEYHSAQDAAQTIMRNDTKDMNLLLNIKPYDLKAYLSFPELGKVDFELSKLELDENYAAAADGVKQIDDSYKIYLKEGKTAFDEIYTCLKEICTHTEGLIAEIERIKAGFAQYTQDGEDENGTISAEQQTEYEEWKSELKGAISGYNKLIHAYNASVNEKIAQYQYLEKELNSLIELLEGAATAKGTAVENINGKEVSVTQYTYEMYTLKDIQTVSSGDLQTVSSGDALPVSTVSSGDIEPIRIVVNQFKEDVEKPSVEVDGQTRTDMPIIEEGNFDNMLDALIGKTEKKNAVQREEMLTDIQIQLNTAVDMYASISEELIRLDGMMNEYDPVSFIKDSEINSMVYALSQEMRGIETKVEIHDTEYNNYTKMIYLTTEENINALKNNIAEEQDLAELKLEEGLSDAKQSRMDSNAENTSLLRALTVHLPYTRIGKVENKEVYAFMATPITLYNKSTDTADSSAKLITAQNADSTVKKTGGQNKDGKIVLAVVGIGGVLIMAAAAGTFLRKKKDRKEKG